jgi:dsRNA-specific ribonuclease
MMEKRDGPAHAPRFTYLVSTADGIYPGEGTGNNATEAKQVAAKKALDTLKKTSRISSERMVCFLENTHE